MAQVQALVWWPCAGSVAGGGLVVSLAAETGFVLSIDTSANLGGGGGKLVSSRLAGGKLVSSMSALDVVGGDAAVAGRGCPSTSSAAGAGPRCCDHWPRMPKTSTSIQSPRLSQGEYLVWCISLANAAPRKQTRQQRKLEAVGQRRLGSQGLYQVNEAISG